MTVSRADIPKTDNRWTRWGLFVGIFIWFVDLNTVYALPSLACTWNWFRFTIAGIPGLVIIEALISLISIVLLLLMIRVSWQIWRKRQVAKLTAESGILQDTEKDRSALMAFVGLLSNGFFVLFIIATFVPMIALNACARG